MKRKPGKVFVSAAAMLGCSNPEISYFTHPQTVSIVSMTAHADAER